MSNFDIAKFDLSEKAEAGYEFELTIPEINEKTGVLVTVRGDNSPKVKAFQRRKFQEYQMKEQVAKRKGREVEPLTIDEAEEMAVESALVRLIGWKNLDEDGKPLAFNEENARRILTKHSWVRDQIISESGMLSNFI